MLTLSKGEVGELPKFLSQVERSPSRERDTSQLQETLLLELRRSC